MKEVKTLVSISQKIGKRAPLWTQGAGGNLSLKFGDSLYIKASGLRLDQVTGSEALAELSLKGFHKNFALKKDELTEENYSQFLQALTLSANKRASMESLFHLVLPEKYVCHFHSIAALLMGFKFQNISDKQKFEEEIQCSIQVLSLVKPGLELGLQISHTSHETRVFILENHGVILQFSDDKFIGQWKGAEKVFIQNFYASHPLSAYFLDDVDLTFGDLKKLSIGPFKIYFPDTAVFADRLRACLRKLSDNTFEWNSPVESLEQKSLWELWIATQMIYQFENYFPELTPKLAAEIADLPIETFRKRIL